MTNSQLWYQSKAKACEDCGQPARIIQIGLALCRDCEERRRLAVVRREIAEHPLGRA